MSDLPPADWYTDPTDESQYRYWDGAAWTEHRAPRHAPAEGDATGRGDGEDPQIRGVGQLLGDMFSITGRRWRSWAVAAALSFAAQAVVLMLLIVSANSVLNGELGEVWDRISDPGFDPESAEQTAYFESLELDFSVVSLAPLLLGLLAAWIAGNVMSATVARVALRDLQQRDLAPADALRQAWRRVPRLMGLDLQVLAVVAVAVLVVVLAGILSPVLLIGLIPALIVGLAYGSLVAALAYVVASVGPATPSLAYGARLLRGRFWRVLGRMLVVLVVLAAASVAVGILVALAGQGSATVVVVAQVVQAVVTTVIAVVASIAVAIIYHDLGGESE